MYDMYYMYEVSYCFFKCQHPLNPSNNLKERIMADLKSANIIHPNYLFVLILMVQ
jgi:hypothetical protein